MAEHFFVLKRGQKIVENILKFCSDKNINSAHISAIGAVSSVELKFYDIHKKAYLSKKLEKELEIVSITGNVAVSDEELILHAHGSFSDSEMNAFGGHLGEAVVAGTCEVFLVTLSKKLERTLDEETGLKLIKS
jgi:uncharacterized protein